MRPPITPPSTSPKVATEIALDPIQFIKDRLNGVPWGQENEKKIETPTIGPFKSMDIAAKAAATNIYSLREKDGSMKIFGGAEVASILVQKKGQFFYTPVVTGTEMNVDISGDYLKRLETNGYNFVSTIHSHPSVLKDPKDNSKGIIYEGPSRQDMVTMRRQNLNVFYVLTYDGDVYKTQYSPMKFGEKPFEFDPKLIKMSRIADVNPSFNSNIGSSTNAELLPNMRYGNDEVYKNMLDPSKIIDDLGTNFK